MYQNQFFANKTDLNGHLRHRFELQGMAQVANT
jgi:hypothetical protein